MKILKKLFSKSFLSRAPQSSKLSPVHTKIGLPNHKAVRLKKRTESTQKSVRFILFFYRNAFKNDSAYLLAADAENGRKLAVKAKPGCVFEIVVEIGNTAARTAKILATRAYCFNYLDVSLGIALAYSLAVSLLAVLFNGNRHLLDIGNTRNKSLRLLLRDKRTHNDQYSSRYLGL